MNEIERIQRNFEQGEYLYYYNEYGESLEKVVDTLLAHIQETQGTPKNSIYYGKDAFKEAPDD